MGVRRPVHDLLDRLATAEERFLRDEFLAPALRGGEVAVRIAGVVCRLATDPDFAGWGVFRPVSATAATLVRPATLGERRRYLDRLPRRRLILCQPCGTDWLAQPAHQGDRRFRDAGLVPVRLAEEVQRFDVVEGRADGVQCWFDGADGRADPAAAAYLRQAFADRAEPAGVRRPGLTAEGRVAYALADELRRRAERDRTEDRLRDALTHAGAEFRAYLERADTLRVEFTVDGRRHVSVVGKADLSVRTAGICLSGEDEHFDLKSLVGVLRESHGTAPRVGADNHGMDEETYWRVHPRRPVR
jgi:hypothetical protein